MELLNSLNTPVPVWMFLLILYAFSKPISRIDERVQEIADQLHVDEVLPDVDVSDFE